MSKQSYSSDNANYIKSSYQNQSTSQVFHQNAVGTIDPLMSPFNLKFRESRDSDLYPNSTGIILGLDITGSMGSIPEHMVREELPSLVEISVKHGVRDPAILFAAVGDHKCDNYPLQVGQFESDEVGLNKWLRAVYLNGAGGGGNNGESYALIWYFAAKKTSIDCFEKRGDKGFIFTYGDEHCHPVIEATAGGGIRWGLKEIFGDGEYQDMTAVQLLQLARKTYNVFHVHCAEGSDGDNQSVIAGWRKLLGENLLVLEHKEDLTKLIATTMALYAGASLQSVTKDFNSKTALSIQTALAHIDGGALAKKNTADTGIAKF